VRPSDFELFLQYHLGLLPDGTAHFQNANQIATRYGVGVTELTGWLEAAQIDAATADGTDYDLPARHAEAQELAMLGDRQGALALGHTIYAEYRARLGIKKVRTFAEDEPAW
jgi:hypothetical protein